jgi:amidase
MAQIAERVDHVIPRDQVIYSFGPDMKPVLEVTPGEVVTFQTQDCFSAQIQTESDLVTDIDFSRINPATGPVSVRGAEPGDSLIVEFLDIRPGPQGVATIIPGYGQLIDLVKAPVTKVLPVRDGIVHFSDTIEFPARPMMGVVGVATAEDSIPNGLPGQHGGNLDNHMHGIGTKIYFPVRQPGGLFAAGDMHASMGDGEICGTGIEIAGEVTVRFGLLKGKQGRWPVSETEETWMTHGTAIDYMDAMREACREAADLLGHEWGMSREDAFILLSIRGDVGVAQACKPSPFAAIARVVMPKMHGLPGPFRSTL